MPPAPKPSKDNPLFHYHGNAYAFSGHFARPFEQQIDVQAASSLCVVGGHGCARVDNFQFRNFISFKAGYTHVSGGHQTDDDTNNTLVTSTIEGLNMMDVLTADRVVGRLYSKHPKAVAEGNITMNGSKFDNLQICGQRATIDLDFDLFKKIQTFKQAIDEYKNADSDFHKRAVNPFGVTGEDLPNQGGDGVFLCSLVKNLEVDHPGVEVDGHSVYVPGFGTVYFAEVFMTHGQRVLTMFRYELGSSMSGSGSGATAASNGRQYPPTG